MEYDDAPMTMNTSDYGSLDGLPDEMIKCFQKCHDQLTLNQLRQCSDYFEKLASNFRSSVEEGLTIEDFEKAKKVDADGDNEEGEKSY